MRRGDGGSGDEEGGSRDELSPSPLPNSQTILEQLYHANLFLMPLDDKGQWYRYHPLFAEVLQHQLRQNQPDLLPLLHRQASRWYAANGLFTDAIRHALLAADFAHAAELIEQIWPTAWKQGALATLLNWVHVLPQTALMARPRLWVSYAWALAFTDQIEAAANRAITLQTNEKTTLKRLDAGEKLPDITGASAMIKEKMAQR